MISHARIDSRIETERDRRFMRLALDGAREARRAGEVPVGAVVTLEGAVLGQGHNSPIARCDPTAHAEIVALRRAAARTGNYRLSGATLYCTVEPCLMCMGAAVHARIERLVFAAADPKVGATNRMDALLGSDARLNHRPAIEGGVLADESTDLLREFFRERRGDDVWRRTKATAIEGEVPKWP